jgi:arylsulfatase A
LKLADNTYVIYATDNGPSLPFKHHGGSAGPLRDGKGSTFEGGQRVPCLIRGPGIPAGTVCGALTGTIDVLPTLAAVTGSELPAEKKIDGLDVSGLWTGKADQSPRNEFLYYTSHGVLEGIRQGPWKLLVKLPRKRGKQQPDAEPQLLLFNLDRDLGEQTNLAAEQPELVEQLRQRMGELDAEIERNARPTWTASG